MKLKSLLLFCFIFIIQSTQAQSAFNNGYEKGFQDGFCYDDKLMCIPPIAPIAPIPSIAESSTNYKDGYLKGFTDGKEEKNYKGDKKYTRTPAIYEVYDPIDFDFAYQVLLHQQTVSKNNNPTSRDDYDTNKINYFVKKAVELQKDKKFQNAGENLIKAFNSSNGLGKKYLYYAAANFIRASNYREALKCYLFLLDNGIQTLDEQKEKEVYKNIALIYIHLEEEDKVVKAIELAKKKNPDDIDLLQVEADFYQKKGNTRKYGEVMEQVASKNPNNPTVFYNLGVTAYEAKEFDKAIFFYEKALVLDPSLDTARLNLVSAILGKEPEIVNKMNSLGTSQEENIEYDKLANERKHLYRNALPYLEQLIKKDNPNIKVIQTTMNIYIALGEENKAKKLQKQLKN